MNKKTAGKTISQTLLLFECIHEVLLYVCSISEVMHIFSQVQSLAPTLEASITQSSPTL